MGELPKGDEVPKCAHTLIHYTTSTHCWNDARTEDGEMGR